MPVKSVPRNCFDVIGQEDEQIGEYLEQTPDNVVLMSSESEAFCWTRSRMLDRLDVFVLKKDPVTNEFDRSTTYIEMDVPFRFLVKENNFRDALSSGVRVFLIHPTSTILLETSKSSISNARVYELEHIGERDQRVDTDLPLAVPLAQRERENADRLNQREREREWLQSIHIRVNQNGARLARMNPDSERELGQLFAREYGFDPYENGRRGMLSSDQLREIERVDLNRGRNHFLNPRENSPRVQRPQSPRRSRSPLNNSTHVLNPVSGRRIRIGGPTWRHLRRRGVKKKYYITIFFSRKTLI